MIAPGFQLLQGIMAQLSHTLFLVYKTPPAKLRIVKTGNKKEYAASFKTSINY